MSWNGRVQFAQGFAYRPDEVLLGVQDEALLGADLSEQVGDVLELLAQLGSGHAHLTGREREALEVPYLGELLARLEYDTIYHEHLSYFAIRPLAYLFNRHGMRLERVEFVPVHGGSVRGTVVHGAGRSGQVEEEIMREQALDLSGSRVKVVGYGAPAKGSVVLNYSNIGTDLLPVVLDSTPAKQGLHVPGTHQLIRPPTALPDENPEVLLLLAWNHAEEIVAREEGFRARGGRFLTPQLVEL